MTSQLSSLIYLVAGLAVVYLFQSRRKKLTEITRADFPELSDEDFQELVILLKTAYERMLYMGVGFFPLAYISYSNGAAASKLIFLALILLLFISNIPPRNKVMRLLDRCALSPEELKRRGITL